MDEPVNIEAGDVIAWIKFNYPDVWADAIRATEEMQRGIVAAVRWQPEVKKK